MAKPRIFLSSTCYDLSIIRDELTRFLEERGFEVINSEKSSEVFPRTWTTEYSNLVHTATLYP